jgi:superfamily II DNA/RNA helicase
MEGRGGGGMGLGGGMMIFCNSKASCSYVHEQLKLEGIAHASIHGALPKSERFAQVSSSLSKFVI